MKLAMDNASGDSELKDITDLKAIATKNKDAAQKRKDAADKVKTAAEWQRDKATHDTNNTDLTAARTLLLDLAKDIKDKARAEAAARATLEATKAKKEAAIKVALELGEEAVKEVKNPAGQVTTAAKAATGAYAIRDAAEVTKQSIDEQQAFHDARVKWAEEMRGPATAAYTKADTALKAADAAVVAATTRLAEAKAACKVAAFQAAQTAR